MWLSVSSYSWTSVLLTAGIVLLSVIYVILRHALFRKKNTVLSPAQVDLIISRVTKALPSDLSNQWHFKGTSEGLRVFEKSLSIFPWATDQTLVASTLMLDAVPKQALQVCLSVSSFPSWFGCIKNPIVTTTNISSSLEEEGTENSDSVSFSFAMKNSLVKALRYSCKINMKRTWKVQGNKQLIFMYPNSTVCLPYEWMLVVFSVIPNQEDKKTLATMIAPLSSFSVQTSTHAVLCSQLCAFKDCIAMENYAVDMKQNTDMESKRESKSTTRDKKKEKVSVKQSEIEPTSSIRNTVVRHSPPVVADSPYMSFGIKCARDLVNVANATEEDGWTIVGNSKGIGVMKKIPTTGSLVNCIKGTKIINAPPDFILRILMDPQHSTVLDDMLKEVKLIKKVSDSIQLLHLSYKAVWPTSPRDFSVCNVVGRVDASTRVHAACSIVDSLIPEVKGHVRGDVIAGGYCIKDVPDDPNSAEVIYITQVDLKGNVPAFVINKIVESQPQCINELNKIVLRERARLSSDQIELQKFEDTYLICDVNPSADRSPPQPDDTEDTHSTDDSSPVPSHTPTTTSRNTQLNGVHSNVETLTVTAEYEGEESLPSNVSGNFGGAFDEDSISIAVVLEKIPPFKGTDGGSSAANRSLTQSIGYDSLLEYPRNEGTVDFRTLSNQIAAKMLEEMFHVNTFDVMNPSTYKDHGGGWKFQGIERDVGLFKKKSSNSPYNSFLGRGIIELPPQEVFNCVRNPNQRYTYDNMLKELHIVKQIEEGLYILHMHHETNQCLLKQSRDFCLLVCERVEPNKKMILGSSVDVSECPPQPGITRGRILTSGWVIEPYRVDNMLYTQVTYVLQIDIGGVPPNLVNLLSKRQPLAVSYIREFLQSTSLTFKEQNTRLKLPSLASQSESPVVPPRFKI